MNRMNLRFQYLLIILLFLFSGKVFSQDSTENSKMKILWDKPGEFSKWNFSIKGFADLWSYSRSHGGIIRLDYQNMKRSAFFVQGSLGVAFYSTYEWKQDFPISDDYSKMCYSLEGGYTFFFHKSEKGKFKTIAISRTVEPDHSVNMNHTNMIKIEESKAFVKRRLDLGMRIGGLFMREPKFFQGSQRNQIKKYRSKDGTLYTYDLPSATVVNSKTLFIGLQRRKTWNYGLLNKKKNVQLYTSRSRDFYIDFLYTPELSFKDVRDTKGLIDKSNSTKESKVYSIPTEENVKNNLGFRMGLNYQNLNKGKGIGYSSNFEGGYLYGFENGLPLNKGAYWYLKLSVGVMFGKKLQK